MNDKITISLTLDEVTILQDLIDREIVRKENREKYEYDQEVIDILTAIESKLLGD